jgi:hypothetical protein
MTTSPHFAARRTLPRPVARLVGMLGFVAASLLAWRLIVGEVSCLAWASAILIYLAGDIVHGRRPARPVTASPG